MQSNNIVFTAPGQAALLREEAAPPKAGEVLCKAACSLISTGTETICLRGVFDPGTNWAGWVNYPFHPGYAASGTVLEVGEGVTGFAPGDRVYSECTHRQFFTEKAERLIHLGEDIGFKASTWVALGRVAQNAVRRAQVQMGDTAVVIGGGQVGQLSSQFIRLCGAARVIMADPIARRVETALALGATHGFVGTAEDARAFVMEVTGGAMADIVCEATGHPAVLAPACRLARTYGKVLLVGDTSEPSRQALGPGVVSNSLSILGSHGSMTAECPNPFYPFTWRSVNETTLAYMRQGRLRVDELVSHRIAPEEAPAMYTRLLEDRSFALGVVIEWDAGAK